MGCSNSKLIRYVQKLVTILIFAWPIRSCCKCYKYCPPSESMIIFFCKKIEKRRKYKKEYHKFSCVVRHCWNTRRLLKMCRKPTRSRFCRYFCEHNLGRGDTVINIFTNQYNVVDWIWVEFTLNSNIKLVLRLIMDHYWGDVTSKSNWVQLFLVAICFISPKSISTPTHLNYNVQL